MSTASNITVLSIDICRDGYFCHLQALSEDITSVLMLSQGRICAKSSKIERADNRSFRVFLSPSLIIAKEAALSLLGASDFHFYLDNEVDPIVVGVDLKRLSSSATVEHTISRWTTEDLIAGDGGYIFFKNGANSLIDQHIGKLRLTEHQIGIWEENLAFRKTVGARYSIPVVTVIHPNKETVYSHLLPEYPISEKRPIRQLQDTVKNRNLTGLVVLEEVMGAGLDSVWFDRTAAYWNGLGACIAYNGLADRIASNFNFPIDQIPLDNLSREIRPCLSDWGALYDPPCFEDRLHAEIKAKNSVLIFDNMVLNRGRCRIYKNPLKSGKVLLFCGSSTFNVWWQFFAESFGTVILAHQTSFDASLVEVCEPDIVIIAVVERFVIAPTLDTHSPRFVDLASELGKHTPSDLKQQIIHHVFDKGGESLIWKTANITGALDGESGQVLSGWVKNIPNASFSLRLMKDAQLLDETDQLYHRKDLNALNGFSFDIDASFNKAWLLDGAAKVELVAPGITVVLPIYEGLKERIRNQGYNEFSIQRRRDCVFVSAGDYNNVSTWLANSGSRNWDLIVAFYGNSDDEYQKISDVANYSIRIKGAKFSNLKSVYLECPGLIEAYEFVWVCDDDLIMDNIQIEQCFRYMRAAELDVASPAFDGAGKISYDVTRCHELHKGKIRLVNFVEMTCPIFKSASLFRFLKVFDRSTNGCGEDFWYCHTLNIAKTAKAAIFDAVVVLNPHDHQRRGNRSEITKMKSLPELDNEWRALRRRLHIPIYHPATIGYLETKYPDGGAE